MGEGDAAALWLAVVGSGLYHGLNPAMGWPLAVAAAMMGNGRSDLARALALLAAGHFAAMALILLPFGALTALVAWQREIRIAAALAVLAMGLWLLTTRHPKALARIRPTRLAFWSFAIATAHGAGLMLLPIYLGLCTTAPEDVGHEAATTLIAGRLATALLVATVHTAAMLTAGGALAYATYRWLGPAFIAKSWFNLDRLWAASLVLVGAVSLWAAS